MCYCCDVRVAKSISGFSANDSCLKLRSLFPSFKELLAFQKCHVILSFVIKRSLQECVERRKIFSAWKNVNDFIHFKLCCILYFNSFFIGFNSILTWIDLKDMRTFFAYSIGLFCWFFFPQLCTISIVVSPVEKWGIGML